MNSYQVGKEVKDLPLPPQWSMKKEETDEREASRSTYMCLSSLLKPKSRGAGRELQRQTGRASSTHTQGRLHQSKNAAWPEESGRGQVSISMPPVILLWWARDLEVLTCHDREGRVTLTQRHYSLGRSPTEDLDEP